MPVLAGVLTGDWGSLGGLRPSQRERSGSHLGGDPASRPAPTLPVGPRGRVSATASAREGHSPLGCVCPRARLPGPVCPRTQTRIPAKRDACAPGFIYRALWAPGPKRPRNRRGQSAGPGRPAAPPGPPPRRAPPRHPVNRIVPKLGEGPGRGSLGVRECGLAGAGCTCTVKYGRTYRACRTTQ